MFESCRPDFLLFSRSFASYLYEPWQEFLFFLGVFLIQVAMLAKLRFSKKSL